jgi:restriction endonuclease S subunit
MKNEGMTNEGMKNEGMKNEGMKNEGMNVKLKHFVSLKKGRNPMSFLDSGIYPYLTMDYLRGRDKDVKYVDFDENLVPVKENEILILWDGANAGEIMESKVGFLSSTMAKISSKNEKLANHYLFYQLKNFEKVLKDFAGGTTIPHLDPQVLLHSSFFIPSLEKQTAIAAFLDDKTAKIDRVIAQKEKMIALLKERKQIIIQNAVTKGLDPNAKMKHSGVEWIGEIPEGWEVKKIKHVTIKIGSGITPSGGGTTYLDEGGVPLLRSQNIHFGRIDFTNVARITEKVHESMSNSKVKISDVLLNITGGSIGRCHYVEIDVPLNVNQHVCIVRPNKIDTKFLNFVLSSNIGQSQIWFFQQGGGREGLNFQALKSFLIPFPDRKEQTAIVTYIETQSAKIDKATKLQEQQIEKLKELKSSLIDGAVTGKIKVSWL